MPSLDYRSSIAGCLDCQAGLHRYTAILFLFVVEFLVSYASAELNTHKRDVQVLAFCIFARNDNVKVVAVDGYLKLGNRGDEVAELLVQPLLVLWEHIVVDEALSTGDAVSLQPPLLQCVAQLCYREEGNGPKQRKIVRTTGSAHQIGRT